MAGANESPLEIMRRFLSPTAPLLAAQVKSTSLVSPSSPTPGPSSLPPKLRIIGKGSCGTVFERSQTSPSAIAIKKGGSEASLWTDFCLTNRVHNALTRFSYDLKKSFPDAEIPMAPCAHAFRRGNDPEFWQSEVTCKFGIFPDSHAGKQPIFTVDRIPPVPQPFRDALIDQFFGVRREVSDDDDEEEDSDEDDTEDDTVDDTEGDSANGSVEGNEDDNEEEDEDDSEEDSEEETEIDIEHIKLQAKLDPDNEDCLIRLYLGANQSETPDSLRNFPLYLDMMEEIGLDTHAYATSMAIGLAVMHWIAMVDGMDTEFVLRGVAKWESKKPFVVYDKSLFEGPPRSITLPTPEMEQKPVRMWMIDFDKAQQIQLTDEDVKGKFVPAFLGNDPYFPRPDGPSDLWDTFRRVYLAASEILLRFKAFHTGEEDTRKELKDMDGGRLAEIAPLARIFMDAVEEKVHENEDWNEEDNITFG